MMIICFTLASIKMKFPYWKSNNLSQQAHLFLQAHHLQPVINPFLLKSMMSTTLMHFYFMFRLSLFEISFLLVPLKFRSLHYLLFIITLSFMLVYLEYWFQIIYNLYNRWCHLFMYINIEFNHKKKLVSQSRTITTLVSK